MVYSYNMFRKYIDNGEEEKNKGTLYHYTNVYGMEGILSNREFWASHSDFLNDKTEIKYSLDICKTLMKDKLKDNKLKDGIYNKFDTVLEIMNEQLVYILSFSTNGDSNLLWSNYSNNDGYNIAFSYPTIIKNMKLKNYDKYNVYPSRVIYEKEQHMKAISEVIDDFIESAENEIRGVKTNDEYIKELTQIIMALQLFSIFFKDSCFSQEEEYRIAFVPTGNAKSEYNCRISNGTFIPFIKIGFSEEFVEGVTIGPKNNMDITMEGLFQFLKLKKYKQITKENIRQSCIPYRY